MKADVVVVGGGVMGASTAFHLAEAGVNVVLVEKAELASGSTSKAAGGVRANFSDELNIALGARSLELFNDFANRPGQEIDLHHDGYLFVLTREDDVALFERSTQLHQAAGVTSQMVSPERAVELSPYLAIDDVLAASWTPGDGHCTPESVVLGYASGARRLGARVLTNTEVLDIHTRGNEITGVRTTTTEIETRCVIDCAGVWSPQISAMVGVDLPITPRKRELIVTEPVPNLPPTAFTIEYSTSLYWHREGRGLLMGFSDPTTPEGWDLARDPSFGEKLAELLERRAPQLLDVGMSSGWAGYYEVTPDHNALVGEAASITRFLYAAGFSGHGFLQGPAVGETLRDMYLGRTPSIDLSVFSVDRFAAGGLRPEFNIV